MSLLTNLESIDLDYLNLKDFIDKNQFLIVF